MCNQVIAETFGRNLVRRLIVRKGRRHAATRQPSHRRPSRPAIARPTSPAAITLAAAPPPAKRLKLSCPAVMPPSVMPPAVTPSRRPASRRPASRRAAIRRAAIRRPVIRRPASPHATSHYATSRTAIRRTSSAATPPAVVLPAVTPPAVTPHSSRRRSRTTARAGAPPAISPLGAATRPITFNVPPGVFALTTGTASPIPGVSAAASPSFDLCGSLGPRRRSRAHARLDVVRVRRGRHSSHLARGPVARGCALQPVSQRCRHRDCPDRGRLRAEGPRVLRTAVSLVRGSRRNEAQRVPTPRRHSLGWFTACPRRVVFTMGGGAPAQPGQGRTGLN